MSKKSIQLAQYLAGIVLAVVCYFTPIIFMYIIISGHNNPIHKDERREVFKTTFAYISCHEILGWLNIEDLIE